MIFLLLLGIIPLYGNTNYILIGPPGSGKGTFSREYITNQHYCHISPGDILRTHIKNGTALGKTIEAIVSRGDYINDSIVFKIIEDEVTTCALHNIPFIIDGFPRNKSGFVFLDTLLENINVKNNTVFVYFIIDDTTCIQRISSRLVCFNCYNIYNTVTQPPLHAMICDQCGHALEKRLGDTQENTLKRLSYYRKTIEPLIDYAKLSYNVIAITQ